MNDKLIAPGRSGLFYLAPGVASLVFGFPLALGMACEMSSNAESRSNLFALLMTGSVALAVLVAPGYYRAWRRRARAMLLPLGERLWIRWSLVGAILVALVGMVLGVVAIIPAVTSATTAVAALLLLLQFEGLLPRQNHAEVDAR